MSIQEQPLAPYQPLENKKTEEAAGSLKFGYIMMFAFAASSLIGLVFHIPKRPLPTFEVVLEGWMFCFSLLTGILFLRRLKRLETASEAPHSGHEF